MRVEEEGEGVKECWQAVSATNKHAIFPLTRNCKKSLIRNCNTPQKGFSYLEKKKS